MSVAASCYMPGEVGDTAHWEDSFAWRVSRRCGAGMVPSSESEGGSWSSALASRHAQTSYMYISLILKELNIFNNTIYIYTESSLLRIMLISSMYCESLMQFC